jgi:hypothetical protein
MIFAVSTTPFLSLEYYLGKRNTPAIPRKTNTIEINPPVKLAALPET